MTHEPLTLAECDLTDFPSMFIDVRRLLTSETWIEAAEHPRLGHVLMCLWMESWHQRPAASLPDNDAVLARLAMCDLKTWKKLRKEALAGWVMCSDGRWYHPVVAEKAMEAWERKQAFRNRTAKAREARHAKRQTETVETPTEATTETVTTSVTEPVTDLRGTGRGRGIRESDCLVEGACAPEPPIIDPEIIPGDAHALAAECARQAGVPHISPGAITRNVEVVDGWLKDGIDPVEIILPTVQRLTAASGEPISSLRYFDREIRHEHARRKATLAGAGEPRAATDKPLASGAVLGAAARLARLRGGLEDVPAAHAEH